MCVCLCMCMCSVQSKRKEARRKCFENERTLFFVGCSVGGVFCLSTEWERKITDEWSSRRKKKKANWSNYWLEIRGKCVNEPLLLFVPCLSSSLARVSSWPVVSWTLKSRWNQSNATRCEENKWSYKNLRYSPRYCCLDWWYCCRLLSSLDNAYEIHEMNVLISFRRSKDDEDLLQVLNVRLDPIWMRW